MWWQWKITPHSPKFQDWSFTVSVISWTLVVLHIDLWQNRLSGISRVGCTYVNRLKLMRRLTTWRLNRKPWALWNDKCGQPRQSQCQSRSHGRTVRRFGECQWAAGRHPGGAESQSDQLRPPVEYSSMKT